MKGILQSKPDLKAVFCINDRRPWGPGGHFGKQAGKATP